MNARSFRERDGWRSFLSTLASIWRMRSRVAANAWPTSWGGCSEPSSRPKRILMKREHRMDLRPLTRNSQRLEKRQQRLFVGGRQFGEARGDSRCFSLVAADSVAESQRCAIVHQARTQPKSPKRGGPELVARAQGISQNIRML